ncbi:MAG: hypothetical protein IPK26_00600 [Planctomycetes bacterium]|nr:hypothetical protein [Planctomycetota bacterium]
MKRILFPIGAAFAAMAAAVAQTPTYVTTRDGCNGATVGQCLTQNTAPLSPLFYSQPYEYAFAVTNTSGAPIRVLGFDFYTASVSGSPEATDAFVFEDATGPTATTHSLPATIAIAQGTMTVNGFNSWWSVSVYPAPLIQPGQAFWIGFNPRSRVSPPMNASGTPGPAPSVYRAPNINGNRWTASTAPGQPAWRIRCTGPAAVPVLTALDLPRIGQPFRLQTSGGDPSSVGFMIWALNGSNWNGLPTPYNLAAFGAAHCFLHTSSNEALLMLLDPAGSGVHTASLPANNALLGVQFFNQAAVSTNANSLGLLTTNMGRGVVGN